MKPFNLQEYFEDLGGGWQINNITGSIFFEKKEVICNRSSARKVLTQFLKQRTGFKICDFLKRNFGTKDGFSKKRKNFGARAKYMYLAVEKILRRHGFMIKPKNGSCGKETEWSLCYADKRSNWN